VILIHFHHDETFVKMIGMKNVIAHGMLIMVLLAKPSLHGSK